MANCDNFVILNVGGIRYTTSRLTLTSFPDSMLGKMFSEEGIPPKPDENGHYFIDRDGTMFRYILNFLRDKKLNLPSNFEEYDQLLTEADLFMLPDLRKGNSYIILNVGGICYTTARSTLTSFPDSMLGKMFSEDGVPLQPGMNGHYFIDRDGTMFQYILNFMRHKTLSLPSNFEEYDQLLAEADFFLLPDLKKAILSRRDTKPANRKGKEVVVVTNSTQRDVTVGSRSCKVEAKPETLSRLTSLVLSRNIFETNPHWSFYPSCLIGGMQTRYCSSEYLTTLYAGFIRDGFKLEGQVRLESEEAFVFSACEVL